MMVFSNVTWNYTHSTSLELGIREGIFIQIGCFNILLLVLNAHAETSVIQETGVLAGRLLDTTTPGKMTISVLVSTNIRY